MWEKLKNIVSYQNKFKSEPWLYLSKELQDYLTLKMNDKTPGTHLIVEVIRGDKGECNVLTGFEIPSNIHYCMFIGNIPFAFKEKTHLALKDVGMDLDREGRILIYPCVDLQTKLTPNPSILEFVSNKLFLDPDSMIKKRCWDRTLRTNKPRFIELLFIYECIESVCISMNSLQIELTKSQDWKNHEEEIANIILDYLETLPIPIQLFFFQCD